MVEQDNIIELVDENDDIVQFEYIMTLEYGAHDYIVLGPVDEEDDDGIVILRIEQDENDEDIYVTIDDDDELDSVFEAISEIMESDLE
ncbi:DUF1292 domain-containing protein [Xylanivirga thermophila]|uniref:DUF1292 domain-containing protein n=1 Tax=Xylanivirga thermophila TaxID=2496273 RepID=UPI00101BBDEE|nr:DUF1292 domain-containing protein [Xylanivirga thermophila]